jgi:hypothetical protein
VLACNFWPLCTAPGHPDASYSWFQVNGDKLPVIDAMRNWAFSHNPITIAAASASSPGGLNPHPIAHYLLISEELWGKQGKNSLVVRAFMQKYKPTMGFSPSEAAFARRVTIFGGTQVFSDVVVDRLTAVGCLVERIQEDGTVIASHPQE